MKNIFRDMNAVQFYDSIPFLTLFRAANCNGMRLSFMIDASYVYNIRCHMNVRTDEIGFICINFNWIHDSNQFTMKLKAFHV